MTTATEDPPLTAEQQAIVRKLGNQWWRLNNLYFIEDQNGRKVKFRCTPIQQRFLVGLHWRTLVLKARQVRISTACALLMLDESLFKSNQTGGIIDKTDLDAQKKLARMKFAYDHMDDPDGGETALVGAFVKKLVKIRFRNAHELQFTNDSKIWAGTSLRGGTVQFLWITEFGPIAANDPTKASEIVAGTLNTVHAGNRIIIESTHSGGRTGLNYELIRLAEQSPPTPNPKQWRLMFFGWHEHPEYALPLTAPLRVSEGQARYFAELERTAKVRLTDEQKNFYVTTDTPGNDMQGEFPGSIEDALRARTEGAIYGEQMQMLRARGRICTVIPNSQAPLVSFWDCGTSDYTCIWLAQLVGLDWLMLNYYSANGRAPAEHAAQLLHWERHYRKPIARHFLPHDADRREASLKTYADQMRECGVHNLAIVPRTPSVWAGINVLRAILPICFFDSVECDKEFRDEDGERIPSGLACLEAYRKKMEATKTGQIVELPIHDKTSHGADALRTGAEAFQLGMLKSYVSTSGGEEYRAPLARQRAIMGRRGVR